MKRMCMVMLGALIIIICVIAFQTIRESKEETFNGILIEENKRETFGNSYDYSIRCNNQVSFEEL